LKQALQPLRRGTGWLLRAVVATLVAATGALLVAQQLLVSDNAWLELSRYLPYPLFVLPVLAAAVASRWLGRWWLVASLLDLALWLTLGMGLQWHRVDAGAGAERLRVMTYNVKVFTAAQQRAGAQAIAQEVARHDPDILVMQDADGLLGARGEATGRGGPLFGLPYVQALGQYVIASRFALRDCGPGQIGFPGEVHRYLRCVVEVRGVELNLVTAHFQSPRAGQKLDS